MCGDLRVSYFDALYWKETMSCYKKVKKKKRVYIGGIYKLIGQWLIRCGVYSLYWWFPFGEHEIGELDQCSWVHQNLKEVVYPKGTWAYLLCGNTYICYITTISLN